MRLSAHRELKQPSGRKCSHLRPDDCFDSLSSQANLLPSLAVRVASGLMCFESRVNCRPSSSCSPIIFTYPRRRITYSSPFYYGILQRLPSGLAYWAAALPTNSFTNLLSYLSPVYW